MDFTETRLMRQVDALCDNAPRRRELLSGQTVRAW